MDNSDSKLAMERSIISRDMLHGFGVFGGATLAI